MIYLDANATSQPLPQVLRSVRSSLDLGHGNPSSVHGAGRRARAELRRNRQSLLKLLGIDRSAAKVIFTSGGTEGCHMLAYSFLGSMTERAKYPGHIISSEIEHAAMLEPLQRLVDLGWQSTFVPCDSHGRISAESVRAAVRPNTALVSLMAANNETGAIQPIESIAVELRQSGYGGAIVSDMIQAIVKTDIDLSKLFSAGVDAVALSGHKFGALTGVGAVIYSTNNQRCFSIDPLFVGGAQEDRLRAGSENMLGVASLAAAAEYWTEHAVAYRRSVSALREQLWTELASGIADVVRITPESNEAICNTLLLGIPGCRGDDLVVALDLRGIAISTGAACSSGKQGRSHVVTALRLPEDLQDSVIRISLDWNTTEEDIAVAAREIREAIFAMRNTVKGELTSHA